MNKKYYLYSTLVCILSFLLFACTDENNTEYDKGSSALVVKSSTQLVELNIHSPKSDAVKFDWTSGTNEGTGAGITYAFEMDLKGNNFADGVKLNLGRNIYTQSYNHEDLNKLLVEEFGALPNESIELESRVIASVMDNRVEEQYSNVTIFSVVPYMPITRTLYLIGSATANGWSADDATPMNSVASAPGGFTWRGKLEAGEFKMITTLGEHYPSYNKGEDNTKLYYRDSGEDPYDKKFDIAEVGNYEINLNVLTKVISIKKTEGAEYSELWFVGNSSGWGFESMVVDPLDPYLFRYSAKIEGEFKIATLPDFDESIPYFRPEVNGTGAGSDLTVVKWSASENANDNKWSVADDVYKVKFDLRAMKIDILPFSPYPMIYMVGDATPSGWGLDDATPMVVGDNPYVLTWEGNLNAGEMKFSCDKQSDWSGDWFTSPVADLAPNGEVQQMIFNSGGSGLDFKWKVQNAGNYKITLNQLEETIIIVKQ